MKTFWFLLLITFTNSLLAQDITSFLNKADTFFSANVVDGKVNYKKIKAAPEGLNELIDTGASIIVTTDDAKTYQAFYINMYNLSVIKGIVENYPVASPLKIPGFFDSNRFTVGGESLTLNAIENKKLRAKFPKEARFHFVLVCAGLGCPPIINKAYLPNTLEEQLQKQTKLALNDPNFIRVEEKKVKISQIFEWYKKDFTQYGSYVEFLNKYRDQALDPKTKIGFYTYNWELNDVK